MIKNILITILAVFALTFICSPGYIRYEMNDRERSHQDVEDLYMKDIFEGSI